MALTLNRLGVLVGIAALILPGLVSAAPLPAPVHVAQASPQRALQLFEQGRAALAQEQWETARQALSQSLELAVAQNDVLLEVRILALLTVAETIIGDYDRLLQHAQQFLAAAEAQGLPAYIAQANQALGTAHFYTGNFAQALTYHQRNLEIVQQGEDLYGLAIAQAAVGETYLALGESELALAFLTTALTLGQATGDPVLAGTVAGTLGKAYAALGQYDQALPYLRQSLAAEQVGGSSLGVTQALSNLGTALFLAGHLEEARGLLEQAIVASEQQRLQLASSAAAIAFFDTQLLTYRTLQQLLVAQRQPEAALAIAEQARAQVFAAQLSGAAPPAPASVDALRQVARDQAATLVVYSLIPKTQDIFIPGRLDNRWLNTLETLLIWVVQPSGEIHFEPVDLQNQAIDLFAYVAETRAAMGIGGRNASLEVETAVNGESQQQRLRRLHQLLIAPIAQHLPADPAAAVVLIPQESLFMVPFAALQDAQGIYLIEQHALITMPSIQVLNQLAARRRSSANRPALIVGNPTMPQLDGVALAPLPGAEQEASAIAPLLGSSPLLGSAATESAVTAQLPAAGVIHLATHGLLDYGSDSGLSGAIALAPSADADGFLTAAEIAQLDLTADLAVLSACDTGLGTITGDGVLGLSRSLMSAGAANVVVSLWAVPDAPTAALMETFYRQMQAGQPKAQALQQAMIAVMAQHRNPRDWAAFTFMGQVN